MDNGGVGRFADGRCPGHRSSVHGKGDGKRGGGEEKAPSNQGSSNPNVRISVEERRALVVPGTENKVPGTIHSEAPPRQIRAASPSPLLPPPYLRERLVPQTSRRKSRVLDVLANDAARCPLCLYRRICVSARVNIYV